MGLIKTRVFKPFLKNSRIHFMCFLVLHGHLTQNNRIQFQRSCIVNTSCFRNISYASLSPNTLKYCKINYQYNDLIRTILNVPVEK